MLYLASFSAGHESYSIYSYVKSGWIFFEIKIPFTDLTSNCFVAKLCAMNYSNGNFALVYSVVALTNTK